ncbi:MAG: TetR/AcrR family transcriptional regulator [Solirubrobacterales bacterium]|nr:TetR/AcrR family transcriptional regulator [Solirubrobacterales bacterium]
MTETATARRSGAASRERFIATTARLLQRQGYAATGLSEIVAASGAPKGSLYFHFPGGKEELAAAAIASAGAQLRDAIATVFASADDVAAAIAGLIDALAAGLAASDYRGGCPIATVALERAGDSPLLRERTAQAFDSWLDAIAARLRAGGLSRARAERRALLVLSAIEGALILARAGRDPGPLQAVREELAELLA